MSEDYYLVCKEKKLYMPAFTMNMAGCSVSDARWFFDFILACEGSEIKFLHEQNDECTCDESKGWKFMNAWHPYKEEITND